MMITIFTPVYNRAYIISDLYQSLCKQTSMAFEWLVIDDGSTDNIKTVIQQFIDEAKIDIRFFSQPNGGKHRAINRGVSLARGSLFFIVDSDDYLENFAVERIILYAASINEDYIGGLCFRKKYYNTGKIVGTPFPKQTILSDSLMMSYKYTATGDKAEVFKTEVLSKYPFPEIDGENFVPEALIWNRLSLKYKLLFIDEGIYLFEYLDDGLTHNFKKNLKRNPIGFQLYYRELLGYDVVPILGKLKALLRLLQCYVYSIQKSKL